MIYTKEPCDELQANVAKNRYDKVKNKTKPASTAATAPGLAAHVLAVEFEAVGYAVSEHGPAVSQHQLGCHFIKRFVHVAGVFGRRFNSADEVQLVSHRLSFLKRNITLFS